MGLLDILNSIQAGGVSNDPRARAAPASQGMSPTAKALLTLLAIYAMKNMRRADAPPTQPAGPAGGNVSAGLPGSAPIKLRYAADPPAADASLALAVCDAAYAARPRRTSSAT